MFFDDGMPAPLSDGRASVHAKKRAVDDFTKFITFAVAVEVFVRGARYFGFDYFLI
ncbi:hypothetical protein Mgra_00008828 [Meloidogyne graminicola]|uniref:Uncharacterized protein n=1 Tax=Meloidogyne graminicola TaxID=189291 RepID=A0A8S9ZER7_9BILA|nr:hypothetical protein Mgra_00008828 [Meloidogyne graminicola]